MFSDHVHIKYFTHFVHVYLWVKAQIKPKLFVTIYSTHLIIKHNSSYSYNNPFLVAMKQLWNN